MFDFIEQGVMSPRDIDFTTRITPSAPAAPTILLVARQLSTADRA